MIRALRKQGYTIVMVEQNFRFAAPLADRFLRHGARPASSQEFTAGRAAGERMERLHEYLGV